MNVVLMGTATIFLYVASIVARWLEKGEGRVESLVIPWQSGRAQLLVLANLGNFLLSILALQYISASQASALTNLSPGFLALALLLSGRLAGSPSTGVTFVLVVVGVWIMNSDENFAFRTGPALIGSGIAIAAGVSFATWAYVMDRVEDRLISTSSRLRLLAMVFFGSYAILASTAWMLGEPTPTSRFDLVVLTLNGLRVALVYYLFQLAIRRAGPLLPSVIVVSQVPLTMVGDRLWLSTELTRHLILGSLLLILGIAALLSDELRRSADPGTGRPATAV